MEFTVNELLIIWLALNRQISFYQSMVDTQLHADDTFWTDRLADALAVKEKMNITNRDIKLVEA